MNEKSRDAATPQFCDACFTGDYPIPLTDRDLQNQPKLTVLREGNGR
jgi:amidophosphoribosyltransferase